MVLSKLQPDTRYSVSVAALYQSGISRDVSTDGRTSKSKNNANIFRVRESLVTDSSKGCCDEPLSDALGGVRNLQVLNPTMTTLNVRWEPVEGRVKEYKVIYAPAAGGAESVVRLVWRVAVFCSGSEMFLVAPFLYLVWVQLKVSF